MKMYISLLLLLAASATTSAGSPKIVVIGAGAAGIAASTKLLENGITDIVVLEAEDRIGGRIHTIEFEQQVLDLGAEWIYGEQGNVVYDMAMPLELIESSGLNSTSIEDLEFFSVNGTKLATEDVALIILLLFQSILDEEKEMHNFDGPLEDFLNKKLEDLIRANFSDIIAIDLIKTTTDWFIKELNYVVGADNFKDVSAKGVADYDDIEGDDYLQWKGKGFKTLFDVLMKKIPNPAKKLPLDEKIMLQKEVTKINWSTNELKVQCKDGTEYMADHVIVTVPLGVLKKQLNTWFEPPLPERKKTAINGMGFGVIDKLFVRFPDQWWSDQSLGFNLLVNEKDKDTLLAAVGGPKGNEWLTGVYQFLPTEHEENILTTWITGQAAKQMEELTESELKKSITKLLQYVLSKDYQISEPDAIVRSMWYKNPHFLGSSAYRSLETEKLNVTSKDLSKPVMIGDKDVLLFAGEATSFDHMGTVHGAIETGWREAKRILNMYK